MLLLVLVLLLVLLSVPTTLCESNNFCCCCKITDCLNAKISCCVARRKLLFTDGDCILLDDVVVSSCPCVCVCVCVCVGDPPPLGVTAVSIPSGV